MAHQKKTKTGQKILGRDVLRPDRPPIETLNTVAPRIKETQKLLEKLERQQLVLRAEKRGADIRAKRRAGR